MTRSKLSWLHGLFGDDILITRQHFVFSEKHVISFSYKSHDFAHLCDFVTKILFHVWNLAYFIFCIVKRQSRTVLSSVLLFLCVTCDLHFSPAGRKRSCRHVSRLARMFPIIIKVVNSESKLTSLSTVILFF